MSREAAIATGIAFRCRRFAAKLVSLAVYRGLTPTATCCRRFAT